jgi:hypothetical protein
MYDYDERTHKNNKPVPSKGTKTVWKRTVSIFDNLAQAENNSF